MRPVVDHPHLPEMKKGLKAWQKRFPRRIKVSVCGRSLQGRELFLCQITDFKRSDKDKQVVLITCTDSGAELNATTSCLHLVKWLIGDSPLAKETRKKQIVLAVPVCTPDAYTDVRRPKRNSGEGHPNHGYWSWKGVLCPGKNPEALAIAKIMERFKPDVHVDMHGLREKDASMGESTGLVGGGGLCRAYIPEIPALMNKAADQAGFGVAATDAGPSAGMIMTDASRDSLPGHAPDVLKKDLSRLSYDLAAHHFYFQPPQISSCVYSYHKYHALSFVMEIGFEQSALVRMRMLFEIGNQRWPTEYYPGYPVNQIGDGCVKLAAWGMSSMERRRSRVEIWSKYNQFCHGHGQPLGRDDLIACCATTPVGAREFLGFGRRTMKKNIRFVEPIDALLKRMNGKPGYDVDRIAAFVRKSPVERCLYFNPGEGKLPKSFKPVKHGLGIRLCIPYAHAKIKRVLLDGYSLKKSKTFGYVSWRGSGTIVQVNIPPGKVRDFHVILCGYDPGEFRPSGFRPEDWIL